MSSDPTPTPDDPLAFIDEAAARAAGGAPTPTGAPVGVDDARRHVHEAWVHAGAGTDVPEGARLRQVKRAVVAAMRPVTSHQVPFNHEIAIAVKDLAAAMEGLAQRVDGADERTGRTVGKVHAALATTEVGLDDLGDAVADLTEVVSHLRSQVEALAAAQADDRAEIRTLRARQDLVLRTAQAAIDGQDTREGGKDPSKEGKARRRNLARLAAEGRSSGHLLADDLADVTRGTRDQVREDVAAFVDDVELAGGGPVVDLGSGRGEWLEVLREHGIDGYGVDASDRAARSAKKRRLHVLADDPVAHLAELPESSVGAVTAFGLADHLPTDALVELLDRALLALRPGGVLVASAANPTSLDVGAADLWTDPSRLRPLPPDLLEVLVLARGFAEAERRWVRPADPALALRADDFLAADPARAESVAARLNTLLAGARAYAIVARKAGGPARP